MQIGEADALSGAEADALSGAEADVLPGPADRNARQRNVSGQEQVQILPIAPQVNAQNMNVLALGDVQQGNANNANTGQATQQSNTSGGGSLK